jgi:anti-sigma-K factor RskA
MSETDDNLTPEESAKLLPAEYVLGVLGASERREFAARLAREPDLAREVARWEQRLGGLARDVKPVAPASTTWSRIELAIAQPPAPQTAASQAPVTTPTPAAPPASVQVAPKPPTPPQAAPKPTTMPATTPTRPTPPQRTSLWQSVAFWRGLGLSTSALAAASIAALAYVGLAGPKPLARTPFMATLGQTSGQPGFVAAIGADGQSLMIVPASLLAADQMSFELWLIPSGGMPHSLGLISAGQPVRLTVPPELVSQVNTETTLAVTREPLGGSPTRQPTSTPIALGKLTNL